MSDSNPSDPREAEWRKLVTASLKKRQCPDTGHRLVPWGNVQIPAGTLSCGICDCFGYSPDEVG